MKRDFCDWVIIASLAVIFFSLGWSLASIVVRALGAL